MTSVHILTEKVPTANSRAFLFPILHHEASLRSSGIDCKIFVNVSEGLADCDVLIVDSKCFKTNWRASLDGLLGNLDRFRESAGKLYWFDTTDGTGSLQTEVLPHVHRYFKGQLLRDRSLYKCAWYGDRIYTDYFHRSHGIEDEEPRMSMPIDSQQNLDKLRVSWNQSLADHSYSWTGIWWDRVYRVLGRTRRPRLDPHWVGPSKDRSLNVSARFSTSYSRATVRYQREHVRDLLGNIVPTNRLSRRDYMLEMQRSKIVVAPFAWGEFNFRDFEAFLSGCILIKPDMSHMETWPDLYQDGRTILSLGWNMDGLPELIELVTSNYSGYLNVAVAAQDTYRRYLVGEDAAELFIERFKRVLSGS